jgi:hypothetical protein
VYSFLLALHSLVSWAVVAAAVQALAVAWAGWLSDRPYAPLGRRSAAIFTAVLDLQLLIGLALHLLASPITRSALSAPGAAMGDAQVRYWFVEHPALALAAVALAHVGDVRAGRAVAERDRWWRAATYFTAAALAVAATVPWPFRAVGRALWPW